ncbi:hypothetical protein ACFL6X_08365 [Candidatus Latescibacterota bacterium]
MPITLVAELFVMGLLPSAIGVFGYLAWTQQGLTSLSCLTSASGFLPSAVGAGTVYLCGAVVYALTEIGSLRCLLRLELDHDENANLTSALVVLYCGTKELSDAVFYGGRLINMLKATMVSLALLALSVGVWGYRLGESEEPWKAVTVLVVLAAIAAAAFVTYGREHRQRIAHAEEVIRQEGDRHGRPVQPKGAV